MPHWGHFFCGLRGPGLSFLKQNCIKRRRGFSALAARRLAMVTKKKGRIKSAREAVDTATHADKRAGGALSRAIAGAVTGAVSGALIGAASGFVKRSRPLRGRVRRLLRRKPPRQKGFPERASRSTKALRLVHLARNRGEPQVGAQRAHRANQKNTCLLVAASELRGEFICSSALSSS
jgi:hypothetical protein